MASSRTSAARVADLERRLAEAEAARAAAETARLDAEARLDEVEEARARLERLLSQMRHDTYGSKSEKLDPDQRNLPFEDVEAAVGMLAAASEGEPQSRHRSERCGERKGARHPEGSVTPV